MLLVARLSLAFVLVVACVHATCSNPSFSYTELVPSAVTVTVNIMSGGTGCSEHYTMDGSTPDCSSTTTFNSTTNSTTPIVLYANTGSSQSQVPPNHVISCIVGGSNPIRGKGCDNMQANLLPLTILPAGDEGDILQYVRLSAFRDCLTYRPSETTALRSDFLLSGWSVVWI
jgi:hypothetical protein